MHVAARWIFAFFFLRWQKKQSKVGCDITCISVKANYVFSVFVIVCAISQCLIEFADVVWVPVLDIMSCSPIMVS